MESIAKASSLSSDNAFLKIIFTFLRVEKHFCASQAGIEIVIMASEATWLQRKC